MAAALTGKRIAFLVAQEGVEEVELTKPWQAVKDAGATPELIAPEDGDVQAMNHLDQALTFTVDKTLEQANPQDYDGVVLPGGVANPDQLRTHERALGFLQQLFSEGKPVGVICHGPVDARRGRPRPRPHAHLMAITADGHPQRRRQWVDQEVVVDQGLVSSRNPDDLPAFCAKIVEEFAEGVHQVARAGATADGRA